jgi:hypothetical protein
MINTVIFILHRSFSLQSVDKVVKNLAYWYDKKRKLRNSWFIIHQPRLMMLMVTVITDENFWCSPDRLPDLSCHLYLHVMTG